MKAKELILRILQLKPNLSTTKLAKLCYLFDLGWTQLHGEQKTELPYQWWHYGPYSKEFERAIWELEATGRIQETAFKTTHKQYDCILHSAVDTKPPHLGKEEEQLLQFILDKFADWDLQRLLKFVYSTPPMLEAKAKNQQFRRLNMKSRPARGLKTDPETARMILESELTDRSRYVPADVVLRKLQTAGA
jgi:hypothetical protein